MTRFLRGLGTYFRSWTGKSTRIPLRADETVARFVFRSEHLRGDGRAKPRAFLPEMHPKTGEHELSVCRQDGCPEHRSWQIGNTCRRDVTLKGRADFASQAALDQKLLGFQAPEPDYAEHAVLVSWPPEDDKPRRLAIAQALADASVVHKPPP